ncbi:hypothetical protein H4R21_001265, partial [Coemansia helicoidea]
MLEDGPTPMPRGAKGGETPEAYIGRIGAYVEEKLAVPSRATYKATIVNKARRALIKELIKRSRGISCQNCRGPLPKLRRDGHLKVFREPLSKKQQMQQQAKGMQFRDVMDLDVAAIDKEMRAKRPAGGEAAGGDMDVDEASEGESSDGEDTDVGDTYDSIDAYPQKQKAGAQTTRVFMTPIHLRNHLRLLFSNEADLVRLLFQQRDPQMACAADVVSGARLGATLTIPRHVRSPVALADIFFVEALPVAPTKFRPASVMNDEVMENPHNVYLGKVLQTCVFMRNLVSPDAGDTHDGRRVAAAAQTGAIGFDRVINSWVQLQQAVNNVMDSSKNPTIGANGSAPDPGIRQILEKKEGLFRQNMMGKRVNFAARSVISPDPNVESDEVGVPLVFAQKLTFPEPVTPHNVKELRQQVINGPETWPGAEAVQNEDGSLVYLGQLSHESR